MEEYLIWIDNKPITVDKPVYKAYWKGKRKERYFGESDIHNKVFYYDALDTEETNGSDIFCDETALPVDELVINHLEVNQLRTAMKQLTAHEYELICRLYFYGDTLRSISRAKNIPLSTLHYRHKRILRKLKDIMETTTDA